MNSRTLLWISLLGVWVSSASVAQTVDACATSGKLGCMIPNLYGPGGLTLPNPFHRAHFVSDFQQNFTPLTTAVATQLTLLPLASPASGFTYTFDRASGVYTRSARSFGPILTDRANTIGRGKVSIGFTYQHFGFSSIDGVDLDHIPTVFRHVRQTGADYESDFVTANNSIDLRVNQFALFGALGVTRWFDVSVTVPVLDVRMNVHSDARIHRIAPPNPQFGEAHAFDDNTTAHLFRDSGTASGIGDVMVRFKGTLWRGEGSAFALAADVRTPTGDERNFLGAGTYGVKPFAAISLPAGPLSLNGNIGYQINGSSLLAGDITRNQSGHLPNQFFYGIGTDAALSRQFRVSFEVLGERIYNATRVFQDRFTAAAPEIDNPAAGVQTYPQIRLQKRSFNVTSAAVGAKWNVLDKVLLTGNLLFRLDDGGLKARVIPLIGLSYTF